MYSEEVQAVFEDHDVSPGDRIRIEQDGQTYEGRLMPRSEQGRNDAIVLKLDNGYNLGMQYTEDTRISVLDTAEEPAEPEQDLPEPDPDKPDVTILHTGGTIASRVSYEEGGVKPAFDPEDLLEIYPELFDAANVSSTVITQMFSEDAEPGHWQEMARAVADHREDADGIIIGHGTDTMHYTAAALSFMLENIDIPVVLVGSQRSSDRPSSDAAVNLLSAVEFINEGAPGVYACMHATSNDTTAAIHHGTHVRKMHTSRRDAFQSIDTDPFAVVDYENSQVMFTGEQPDVDGEFTLRDELDDRVGMVTARPGMCPATLEHYTDTDHRGLVVAGTGLGHLPVNSFDEHTEQHDDVLEQVAAFATDGVVAMSSQCLNGRVNMNVYESGVKLQEAGVVSAANMIPEVAYVKLMWALGQTDSVDEAEELFQKDVAGELLEREEYRVYSKPGGDGDSDE